MAIRKVGNIYEGKGGLRKVGNIYADPEHQEREEKKQAIIKENLDKAEKYYQEAEDASSILGLAKNTAKGLFSGDTYSRIGKQIVQNPVNTVKSVGTGLYEGSVKPVAELLTPKKYEGIYDIGYKPKNDVEQSIQSGFGFAGAVAPYAALSKGIQLAANAPKIVNATQNIPILGKAVSILGKSEIARDFTSGIVGGQILTDAQDAKGRAEQFGLDVILEGIMAGLSRGMVRVGKINKKEVSETINDVSDIRGERPTAEQERKIEEAFLNGATKEEIVDEVGKAKIAERIENPQPRLAEVVDQLEADGRKLSVEETMTVKTELEAGKSIDEIKAKLDNPVESPETALKSPTRAETPETVPKAAENSDEAFLKAVEERFKASKTNKFREATRDEKGQFTGSRKGITGDAERDELAQAIQNRIDAITDDSIPSFSAREDLRAIQEQVARAKTDDLARLKIESDRIADEFIKQRAAKIAPRIDKEKKIAAVRTIASESDNFNEFQLNLKRRGEDITTIFKSKAAAEEFFRKNSGQKFRVAENPLLQEIRSGKYKSAEEFVKAQGDTVYHGSPNVENIKALKASTGAEGYFGNGVYLSRDKAVSGRFTKREAMSPNLEPIGNGKFQDINTGKVVDGGKPGVIEVSLPKSLKLKKITIDEMDTEIEKFRQPNGVIDLKGARNAIRDKYAKQGFDGFEVPATKNFDEPQTVIFPQSEGKIKTKSQLIDLWKKAQGEKFRDISPRFEELTGTKLTPEQEAKIKALHKKMFGDDGIEITAQILTPEGQKAFGVYKNKVIKILDGQVDPTDTLYHEAVHKYLDLFTTLDEQKRIYVEARKLWKTDNLDELEEKIAENFIRYAKTNEGVVGTMKVLFDKVIDRIKTAISGESSIEALYKDILEGKAKKVKEVKIASVEPKKTVEKPLAQQTDEVKNPKTSVIASRLNEALPDGMKIDETYEPKVIKEELDKAANAIGKDKEKAIQKAFDPNTNPVERDAILIELSEIAKRDGDYAAMADLFQRRTELIRSGAQSLNMEKASILMNPQEKYMRDIVNARLSKVKVNGKDLTDVEVASIRKSVRKETSEAAKKAFKIQDAQELFNSLIC